jgi:hypothetical protein
MKKKQIILISILACSLLLIPILSIQANAQPEQAGGLIIINQLLTEIQTKLDAINQKISDLLTGQGTLTTTLDSMSSETAKIGDIETDIDQIKTETSKISGIDTKIDVIDTKIGEVSTKVDEISIPPIDVTELLEEIETLQTAVEKTPILHEVSFESTIPQEECPRIFIECDKTYEIKAIHFLLIDPDMWDKSVTPWVIKDPSEYVWPKYMWLSRYITETKPLTSTTSSQWFDALNLLGISVNPANGAGEKTILYFIVSNHELIDFDETLSLRIIISAPPDAVIEVSLS